MASDVEIVGSLDDGTLVKVEGLDANDVRAAISIHETVVEHISSDSLSGEEDGDSREINPGTGIHEVLSVIYKSEEPITNNQIEPQVTLISQISSTTAKLYDGGYVGRFKTENHQTDSRRPYRYYINEAGQEFIEEAGLHDNVSSGPFWGSESPGFTNMEGDEDGG